MRWLLFLPLVIFQLHSFEFNDTFEKHFAKIEVEDKPSGIEGIDCIYVINLDRHTQRWEHMKSLLEAHHLSGNRVSAVNGRAINKEDRSKLLSRLRVDKFSDGTIGCFLSHVSIWKDAYERGFKRIWVIEDDINFLKSPIKFSSTMRHLDKIDPKWDVLYGDYIKTTTKRTLTSSLNSLVYGSKFHLPSYYKEFQLTNDIITSPCRIGTWSMIISRDGIEKLLNHTVENKIIKAVDRQLHLIEGFKMYSVIDPFVEAGLFGSSTCNSTTIKL